MADNVLIDVDEIFRVNGTERNGVKNVQDSLTDDRIIKTLAPTDVVAIIPDDGLSKEESKFSTKKEVTNGFFTNDLFNLTNENRGHGDPNVISVSPSATNGVFNDEQAAENSMVAVDQFLADLEMSKQSQDNDVNLVTQATVHRPSSNSVSARTNSNDGMQSEIAIDAYKYQNKHKRVSWAEEKTVRVVTIEENGISSIDDVITEEEGESALKMPEISDRWWSIMSEIEDGKEEFIPVTTVE